MTLSSALIDDEEAQAHEFQKLQGEENWKAAMIWGKNQSLKKKTSAWDHSVQEDGTFTNGVKKPRVARSVPTPQQAAALVPQLPIAEPSSGSVQPIPLENIGIRKFRCQVKMKPPSWSHQEALQKVRACNLSWGDKTKARDIFVAFTAQSQCRWST